MKTNLPGAYEAPSFARAASAASFNQSSPIDQFIESTTEASRLLSLAQTNGFSDDSLNVLRSLIVQRHVAAFERYTKTLVSAVINETGQFDSNLSEQPIKLKYILDHGMEGLGTALLERDVLGNVEGFLKFFDKIAPNSTPFKTSTTADLLADILQIRHSIVHHLGEVTKSDARKFRAVDLKFAKSIVVDDSLLQNMSVFLDWSVRSINDSICRAVMIQHKKSGYLCGEFVIDKQRFLRLVRIFYCVRDNGPLIARHIRLLHGEYCKLYAKLLDSTGLVPPLAASKSLECGPFKSLYSNEARARRRGVLPVTDVPSNRL